MISASRALGTCIGIGGTIFTSKFQTDMLVPVIPLFWHPTDLPMQAMAARTFGALKIAIKTLEDLYSTSTPMLTSVDLNLGCPYPRQYIDVSGVCQAFLYEKVQDLRHRLIFYGTTENGMRICIKFVKKYSPEAHRFCALHGHAPELLAYERLPGGWGMVVMDVLEIRCDDDDAFLPRTERSYQRFSQMSVQDLQALAKAVTDFIHELHAHGYVHGDLRDVNLFARPGQDTTATSDFTILDFEWAGRIDSDETCYPMYINREDIRRPLGAQDGMKIEVEHDLKMLRYLFHPYEDEAYNDDWDV
jgi:serine/threonine protein kinase